MRRWECALTLPRRCFINTRLAYRRSCNSALPCRGALSPSPTTNRCYSRQGALRLARGGGTPLPRRDTFIGVGSSFFVGCLKLGLVDILLSVAWKCAPSPPIRFNALPWPFLGGRFTSLPGCRSPLSPTLGYTPISRGGNTLPGRHSFA